MSAESDINNAIQEIHERVINTLPRRINEILSVFENVSMDVTSVLIKHSNNSSGKVSITNLPAVIREVEALEGSIYRKLRKDFERVVSEVALETTESIAPAIVGAIGSSSLLSLIGASSAGTLAELITAEVIFSLVVGEGLVSYTSAIVSSIFNRKAEDDKVLRERLLASVRLMLNDVIQTLRKNISNGEDTSSIGHLTEEVRNSIEKKKPIISRLVESETLNATRLSVARFAEKSGLVKGLRIIDFPFGHAHGNDAAHVHHKCFIYSEMDEHGMGKGVYPVTTRKIRNPHPQCRAILQLVLTDEANGS